MLGFFIHSFNSAIFETFGEIDVDRETLPSIENSERKANFFLEINASIADVHPLCKIPSLANNQGLISPSYST